jgi:AcrR family transcriptional regulator
MAVSSEPRERLLETASRLFYQEGIHTVGVDRLVNEAGVTRATFYRHFPTKDDLVVAYLRGQDVFLRERVKERMALKSKENAVVAVLDLVGERVCTADFRGCNFVNASAEFPDPDHPVRQAVAEHRAWFESTMVALAKQAGHPRPKYAAAVLVLLHDGALAAGELDDPAKVRATLHRVVRELFGS